MRSTHGGKQDHPPLGEPDVGDNLVQLAGGCLFFNDRLDTLDDRLGFLDSGPFRS